jgi:hypothetical protein
VTEPDNRAEQERIAKEAERLRTDEPFARAVTGARNAAVARLAEAEQALVQAVLTEQPTGEAVNDVRRLQAKIEAIDALTTEIAHIIIRGTPRVLKPVA